MAYLEVNGVLRGSQVHMRSPLTALLSLQYGSAMSPGTVKPLPPDKSSTGNSLNIIDEEVCRLKLIHIVTTEMQSKNSTVNLFT